MPPYFHQKGTFLGKNRIKFEQLFKTSSSNIYIQYLIVIYIISNSKKRKVKTELALYANGRGSLV